MSPVGERSCVKGNSKFTGGVFAEADEKFRENNDEIKRRNVCTPGCTRGGSARPSFSFSRAPTRRFPTRVRPRFYALYGPGMLAAAARPAIEIVSKIRRQCTRAEWLKRCESQVSKGWRGIIRN